MKTYEMLYILDSAASDEAKDALIKKFEDIITSANCKVVSTDKWGVKKLAYPKIGRASCRERVFCWV